jgi:RecB family exonuclease
MTAGASNFSQVTPNFPTAWDSTMLGTFKECPAKFYYQHILGFQPPGSNIHLHFGQLFHKGKEHYYHFRAEGLDHQSALNEMVEKMLEESGTRDATGAFQPWSTADHPDANIKNRQTLIRSLVWTCEDERNLPFTTYILANGKPAVELSFRFQPFEVGGEPVTFCGHLDRLVTTPDDRTWVQDHKTTKQALSATYFRQFSPHNQFSLYTIAGKVVLDAPCQGVLVSGVQIGVNFTRSALHQVPRPEAVLTEWLHDAKLYIEAAYTYARANHWPMNDKSCGNYGGCPFQRVCAVSPSHRPQWLTADFTTFDWNPLVIRGDI